MKLYIKEKFFSIPAHYSVYDERGEEAYTVDGEFLSLVNKRHIYDRRGNEVAFVQQKFFTLLPRFMVFVNGVQVCEIVKEFTFFRPSYHIEGMDWVIEGDFWAHDYGITSGGMQIAGIHKVWFSWGDAFEMDIDDRADTVTALAVILAIDAVLDAQASSAASANNSANG